MTGMNEWVDIHHKEKAYHAARAALEHADILDENKALALDFDNEEAREKKNVETRRKTLSHLRRLSLLLGKTSFKQVTRGIMRDKILPGIEAFQAEHAGNNPRTIGRNTVNDYKKTLKKFYKWMNGGDDYPDCMKGIHLETHQCKLKSNDMITEDELLKLINTASTVRDKALVSTLFEAHCRIGEFLNLRIKDVVFEEDGVFMDVPEIKGRKEVQYRKVFIKFSKPWLAHWLSTHPNGQDTNSPVWVSLFGKQGRMTYSGVRKLLYNLGMKAGVRKPMNPHAYRHSGSTYEAGMDVNAQVIAMRNGHSLKQATLYTHLSGKQQKDEILRKRGDLKDEIPTKLMIRICPKCRRENAPSAKTCDTCGTDLSKTQDEVIQQLQSSQAGMERSIDALKEQMEAFIQQGRFKEIKA